MKVNNFECGIHDDAEVWIQTTPRQLEATDGQVYLTALELKALLSLVESQPKKGIHAAGRGGVLDLGMQAWKVCKDAGWIVYVWRRQLDWPIGVVEYQKGDGDSFKESFYYELKDERFFVFRGDETFAPEDSYRIDENDGDRRIPVMQ